MKEEDNVNPLISFDWLVSQTLHGEFRVVEPDFFAGAG